MADLLNKASVLDPTLPRCTLGESPIWDAANHVLYWVDIEKGAIHSYQTQSKVYNHFTLPSSVSFIVSTLTGTLIAGMTDGLYNVNFSQQEFHLFTPLKTGKPYLRFNDGACDRQGRLYAGTMSDKDNPVSEGALYRLDHHTLKLVQADIPVSNGLTWSPAGTILYHADTERQTVWQYDYDPTVGISSNRRVFKNFSEALSPDGLTIDREGRLYIALYNGGRIERYTPDGQRDAVIVLPVDHVTNCVFGGDHLQTLFITTALDNSCPLSGHIFTMNMDTTGCAEAPLSFESR